GRGIGRALVRAACAAARDRGARRLTLRVLGHNVPARALYAAEGFVVEGVLPGEFLLDGEYVDDVLMGRAIGPDSAA
ncbi:N-acetyltransferase, partial [Streptomyces triticagri]